MGDARRPGLWRRFNYTPFVDVVRGRISGRYDVEHFIARAELPGEVEALIRRVVKRARIEQGERAGVAADLADHFADGLAAGEPAERLIARFGDADAAARLIGRAKRHGRWCRRIGLHHALHVVWALPAGYVVLGLLLLIGEPEPTVDYLAQINAEALAVPEEDRAWPLYRRALVEEGLLELELTGVYTKTADGGGRVPRPGDSRWDEYRQLVVAKRRALELIHAGAAKPGFGLVARPAREVDPQVRTALGWGAVEPTTMRQSNAVVRLTEDLLLYASLPQLNVSRRIDTLLAADLVVATAEGDGERILADTRAMVGLARQLRENPLFVMQSVSRNDVVRAMQAVCEVLWLRPDLLSREQLMEMRHLFASFDGWAPPSLAGDRLMMLDLLQRYYTPSGRVTDEGLRMMASFMSTDVGERVRREQAASVFFLPATFALAPAREGTEAELNRLLWLASADLARPLWVQMRQESEAERRWEALQAAWPPIRLASPLVMGHGSYSGFAKALGRSNGERDACSAVLALEIYRMDHGAYPATLDELVPRYLAEPAVDHSTGRPLLYRLVDGRPLLYGRGADGDDDGGVREDSRQWHPSGLPAVGDWVLFPPLIEPEVVEEAWPPEGWGYEYGGPPPGYGAGE